MTAYHETHDGLLVPRSANGHGLREAYRAFEIDLLESRIADLERDLARGHWRRLGDPSGRELSRDALDEIVDLARMMYLRNPLVNRAVEISALYVFGQDLSVSAADEGVRAVVDRFWDDNRATLTGQQAGHLLEVELVTTGNVFLALFPVRADGRVLVRSVPMEEIRAIVSDPEDRATVRFYRRTWTQAEADGTGDRQLQAFHPDWRYAPEDRPQTLPWQGEEVPVAWDAPICHVKIGAFPHWRWGCPEVAPGLDWARAYKRLLEDDATRSQALARFAYKLTTEGGKTAVEAARAKLATTLGAGNGGETNPPPAAGSTYIRGGKGQDLEPIDVSRAILPVDHSRPARLMASAGLGISDHFFDSDVGNYATAATLDRPTELRFAERRALWLEVYGDLLQWAIDADLAAAGGLLDFTPDAEARAIDLGFPDLLERDVTERVAAIVSAATLNGQPPAGTLAPKTLTRLLLSALGEDDIDGELANLFPEEDAEADRPERSAMREAEALPVEIGPDELRDAVEWWDSRFKPLAGILSGEPDEGDE